MSDNLVTCEICQKQVKYLKLHQKSACCLKIKEAKENGTYNSETAQPLSMRKESLKHLTPEEKKERLREYMRKYNRVNAKKYSQKYQEQDYYKNYYHDHKKYTPCPNCGKEVLQLCSHLKSKFCVELTKIKKQLRNQET